MRFFGLTTARVVAENFLAGSRNGAYKLLGGLTARGELHRHEHSGGTYFTANGRPLAEPDLEKHFALLWYCRVREEPRTLLSPRDFAGVIKELGAIVPLEKPPRFVPCIHAGRSLLLPRVHPTTWEGRDDELNSALGSLQGYVSSPAFLPWWHFARHGLLSLAYLVRKERHQTELSRWIGRHPLVSVVGQAPVEVPVQIAAVPTFPGAP